MCTIASMPRLPEHCVEYGRMIQWPKEKPFGGVELYSTHKGCISKRDISARINTGQPAVPLPDNALDGDNPEHIQWVFERAEERAAQFSITGVTYRLTQGESHLPH